MKLTIILLTFVVSLNSANFLVKSSSLSVGQKNTGKFNTVKSKASSHEFHGKSKPIEDSRDSPHTLGNLGINAKGNITKRQCDDTVNSCWNKTFVALVWKRCLSHRCTKENRIERRRDLLHEDAQILSGIGGRKYRSLNDKKVTDKLQGTAGEPMFEDESTGETSILVGARGRSGGHANEVGNVVPENQVVTATAGRNKGSSRYHHQEVNENDKRMKETGTLASSTVTDKKTSSSTSVVKDKEPLGHAVSKQKIAEDKAMFFGDKNPWTMSSLTKHDRSDDNRKTAGFFRSNDNPEFLDKLEKTFDLFGDYILAVILRDLKEHLLYEKIFEGYQERVKQVAAENGGNIQEAAESIQNEIKEQFGNGFQTKLVQFLETLVNKIEL